MKATDEQILKAYADTESVWKAAKIVGMCGQVVHRRLARLGAMKPSRSFSDQEKKEVRAVYAAGFIRGDGILDALVLRLGRSKQAISRFAKTEGLTTYRRKASQSSRQVCSVGIKRYLASNPHPRGTLGLKHSDATKMKISWQSLARWEGMTPLQRSQQTRRQLDTRIQRYGTLVPPRSKVTWKQGWREVVGRRIYFRSRWEYNYAVYLQSLLDAKEIAAWDHEPETFWFDGVLKGNLTYLPDFKVSNNDGSIEYHEVKGWMDARSRIKLKRMKQYHPTVKIVVIGAAWFKSHASLSGLAGWEHNDPRNPSIRLAGGETLNFEQFIDASVPASDLFAPAQYPEGGTL